jgi:hypothetical protein
LELSMGPEPSAMSSSMRTTKTTDFLPAERIKKEVIVPIQKRQFKLFFEDEKFKNVLKIN